MRNSGKNKRMQGRTSRMPFRTLVVDDSPIATGAIRVLLRNRREIEFVGFAGDGDEGVCRAEKLQPDLILMDLQMPKLDGLSAIRLIRKSLPNVRIIVVTFNHGQEVSQVCMAGGADGIVVKDRLYQDLLPEIYRVFRAKDSANAPPLFRR